MKAVVYEKYGELHEVLELKEMNKPTPKENEVLIKIHASAINFADSGLVRGKPYLGRLWSGFFKPKNPIMGAEFAGIVESVGKDVKRYKPGDRVFADIGDIGFGGFAEYVAVPEKILVLKPANLTFEEAAVVPVAAVVALQGLRNHGKIQSGQKILINGASGGIGTFAVQIAKSFGAEVTGVCSTKKVDMLRSIGADHVIDYTKEDFSKSDQRYDLILDIAVTHSISDYKRVLNPKGIYVAAGFNSTSLFFGPLISMFGSKKVGSFLARINTDDLTYIKELIEAEKIVPIIDRSYPLSEVVKAIEYYEQKHTQGKITITIVPDKET